MNRGLPGRWLRILGASILGLASTGVALAQQESSADQLQEVVVTAQKRTSTVQETPISITALTGQDLEDRGINDIQSIVQSVPGVSMRTSGPG
ncbi:MAG: TonB-dependent receptor plug domain-containing protein, partial [Steroidobacteraceae bacterium]